MVTTIQYSYIKRLFSKHVYCGREGSWYVPNKSKFPTRLYTIVLQKTLFFILECSLLRISKLTDVIALGYMYKEKNWHNSYDVYQSVWICFVCRIMGICCI